MFGLFLDILYLTTGKNGYNILVEYFAKTEKTVYKNGCVVFRLKKQSKGYKNGIRAGKG